VQLVRRHDAQFSDNGFPPELVPDHRTFERDLRLGRILDRKNNPRVVRTATTTNQTESPSTPASTCVLP